MRQSFPIFSGLFLFLLLACGEQQPVSTGSKAPGIAPKPATTTPVVAVSGDVTKGQTALVTCNSCHATGAAHALTKTDVASIDTAAAKSYHSSVASTFTASANDIKAYLATK